MFGLLRKQKEAYEALRLAEARLEVAVKRLNEQLARRNEWTRYEKVRCVCGHHGYFHGLFDQECNWDMTCECDRFTEDRELGQARLI